MCWIVGLNEMLARKNPHRRVTIHPNAMLIDIDFMQTLSAVLKSRPVKQRLIFVFAVRPFMADYDDHRNLQLLKLTKPIVLKNLDPVTAALIQDPVQEFVRYETTAVDRLTEVTAGHPYLLQFMLKDLI